jgi:N-acetylmuramoyl-L-alanine amidase
MKNIMIILLFLSFLFCGARFAETGNQNPINTPTPAVTTNAVPPGTAVVAPSPTPWLTNPIQMVAPVENAHLPAILSTFVCGSVPAGGKLSINGTPAPVHPGGGFLAMVPLSPGEFQIKAELITGDATYNFTRTIFVAGLEQPAPVSPVTIEYVTPRQDQEVLPGDYVDVVCKGSPGMKAYFTVKGVRKRFPMIESGVAPGGIYQGVYQVGNKDKLKKSRIKVTLAGAKNEKKSKETDGALSLFPNDVPVMVETTSPDVVLRAGPALAPDDKAGYVMFPPLGTLLQVTGRKGDEYRVRLTKTKTAWVSANQVKRLPEGTLPTRVVAGSISMSAADRWTKIRIPLARKIPFEVDPDVLGNYIDISLFGAFSNTDWIINAATGVIKALSWFQDDEETYRLRAYTIPNGWWGYDARYEGNSLILELRTPPPITAGSSSLQGLIIAIDAGHGIPDNGAVGATGYAEKDANLALAMNLREKLLAGGAKVIMIRNGNENVALMERTKIAWQNKADILISIHNNSLGYGGNPFIKHGYGVYYFTPMSLPLAREIHAAYGETTGAGSEFNLPDDGLYYGNLALARAPQMPSVLTESAYMIVPEEEAYLKTDSFRSACANAIIRGIERYAHSMRPEITKVK